VGGARNGNGNGNGNDRPIDRTIHSSSRGVDADEA
jgi:hypothetical protein